MTSLKQRARDLLHLRGRVPEEVKQFLRDVVELEPVAYARVHDKGNPHFGDVVPPDSQEAEMWAYDFIPLYTLGADHDPA